MSIQSMHWKATMPYRVTKDKRNILFEEKEDVTKKLHIIKQHILELWKNMMVKRTYKPPNQQHSIDH
jgi:hypothetical protein